MAGIVGGEFKIEDIPDRFINDELSDIRLYASGRTSLYAILQTIKGKKRNASRILIPDYICESVPYTIRDCGWSYLFYHVGMDLMPELDRNIEADCILLVNYFGGLFLDEIKRKIREMVPDMIIISDDVQNYYGFLEDNSSDFSFTSLRKWFCTPDGSRIKKGTNFIDTELPEYMGEGKFVNYKLAGNLLKKNASEVGDDLILDLLEKGEELLDGDYLHNMSETSMRIYAGLDIEKIGKIRMNNARFIHDKLSLLGIKHLYNESRPQLFVPVFLEKAKRNSIRKKLFDNNIFCPVHWKSAGRDINGDNELYDMELSLICDQRYTEDDLEPMLEIIANEY